MIGLSIKFECPSCGNMLRKVFPSDNISQLKRNLVKDGMKCGCGRKGNFNILDFDKANYVVKVEDEEIEEAESCEEDD